MGRISFFLFVFCMLWFNSRAELRNELTWHEGVVVFTDQTAAKGDLHLDMDLGLLMVRQSGSIKTFPAFKVRQIEYFDEKSGKPRYFVSLPYKTSRLNHGACLFEVVLRGDLIVLRKEQNNFASKMEAFMGNYSKFQDPYDEGNYVYFLYDGEKITKLRLLTRKRLTNFMEQYAVEMRNYVKEKGIVLKDTYSRIKVVAYYNALSQCKRDGQC